MMITIDDTCIHCGLCVQDCPAYVLELQEGIPALVGAGCIRCGHCEAICPTGAFFHQKLNHDEPWELKDYPVLDGDTAQAFLRARRSIRRFQDKPVSQEETQRLLNIGRYAQTGSNQQGVSYLVTSTKETKEQIRALVMEWLKNNPDEMVQKIYASFQATERDRLFRGAPQFIFAMTKKGSAYTVPNARYSLTYLELLAPSLGLGTCWAGYLERYTSTDSRELRELLQIPEDRVISGALLYGYPQPGHRYYRLPGRDPLQVHWR